jgi:hypothetical protein
MRPAGARSLLAAALVAACGCSFVAVRRPPLAPVAPDEPLRCTQSRTAPSLDTAGAILTPLTGLMLWGLCSYTQAMQGWASDPQNLRCGPLLWGTVASTAAFTASAVYGFHATGECRRLAEQRRAPGPAAPR